MSMEPKAAGKRDRTRFVNRRQLAGVFSVNVQTIAEWERAGCPVEARGLRGTPSLFSVAKVRQWRAARDNGRRTPDYVSLEAARTAQAEADSRLKRQLLATRAAELLSRVEVERVWAAEIAAVRSRLLAAPVTWADRVHRTAIRAGAGGRRGGLARAHS